MGPAADPFPWISKGESSTSIKGPGLSPSTFGGFRFSLLMHDFVLGRLATPIG